VNNPALTMLSAPGASVPTPTTSLDLPPALAGILSMGSTAPANTPMQSNTGAGLSSGMMGQQSFVPSYQAGGMIGAGGMPEPTSVGLAPEGQTPQGGAMAPQMLEMQVNQFATQHPEQVNQIRTAIMEAMQSGELTQQELNMVVQLATVAAQNPEMYPYVRNFAIQQGIAMEQDLPPQYDQGLVFVLLLAARALQADAGGQNMMQGGSPAMAGGPEISASQVSSGAIPSMAKGGMTPESKKSDGSVLINAHEGEFVIPANVVKMKGKEFFDSLVEKYRDVQ
jgi:hypothetical protein